MIRIIRAAVVVSVIGAGVGPSAYAQWTQQTLELGRGWNAVFLELDPFPQDADGLFAGLPIESAWLPAPSGIAAGRTCPSPDDPACVPRVSQDWFMWVPPTNRAAVFKTLRVIRGGKVYLIKTSQAATLNVVGQPYRGITEWRAGPNLVGFPVVRDVASAPTFAEFFAPVATPPSTQLANARVFQIENDGSPIPQETTAKIVAQQGYWVYSSGAMAYDGPVHIDNGSLRGIDFALGIVEHSITLSNLTSGQRTVTLRSVPIEELYPAPPDSPIMAGVPPLEWLDYGAGGSIDQILQWRPLDVDGFELGAHGQGTSQRSVRVAIKRAGLPGAQLGPEGRGSQYQGVLEVTDGHGFRRSLRVAAQVRGAAVTAASVPSSPHAGLWAGSVTMNQVSWVKAGARRWTSGGLDAPVLETPTPDQPSLGCGPADPADPSLRCTPTEFSFPIILHANDSGGVKFLTEVTLMFRPGNPKTNTPGEYVPVTPFCSAGCLATLEPGSIRDGEPYSRRITTAAFGHPLAADASVFPGSITEDLPLTGTVGESLHGHIEIRGNHRLNPFRHKYHPDHDCTELGECYTITRDFTLAFDAPGSRPPGNVESGLGDSRLTGTFDEFVVGLFGDYEGAPPVHARGRFEIVKVELNPGETIAGLNGEPECPR